MENFRFHQKKQEDGETIQQFIATLHKLSVNYKMDAYLKTTLRNQFVFGISNRRIQSRLLEIKDLTFDKACQVALIMEMSEKGGVQLQTKKTMGSAYRWKRRCSNQKIIRRGNAEYEDREKRASKRTVNRENFDFFVHEHYLLQMAAAVTLRRNIP